MLLNTDVESSDSRAKFVTLKTYKAAGGRIATDLFQEKEYILDETLLNELVMKKLTDASDALVALGWKWVVIEEEGYDYLSLFSYKKIDVERVGAPDELLHKLAAAEQELKEFDDLPWSPENDDRQASLEALVLSLTNKLDAFCQFTPDQISSAGAFVTYSDEGELLVLRGYMTFADRQALEGETVGESDDDEEEFEGDDEELGSDDEEDEESVEPEVISDDISYSQAHVADMNCYYRQGLQAELVKHEALAYDLLVFTLADQLLGSARAYELPLDIRATTPHLIGVDIDETGAASVLNSAKNGLDLSWTEIKAQDVRFSAFCELSAAMKASILAYCVGVTSLGQPMKKHCKVLSLVAEKTNFSLQKYWQPTAANYFSRIDKASIASIGSALTGKDFEKTHEKAKKSELASFVEKMPEVKGWLPTYLK